MPVKGVLFTFLTSILIAPVSFASMAPEERVPIKRTASGKPDLSGTYNAATLTPLERPTAFGDRLFLTEEEAETLAEQEKAFIEGANAATDPDRKAPAVGGAAARGFEDQRQAGELLGAGNVGGYNFFWVDRGSEAFSIDGKFRTSILTDPANGRRPAMQPEALEELTKMFGSFFRNDGTAWWLDDDDPSGPYDNVEQRPATERCLLGFSGGPPMIPSLYNNFVRVIQTDDYVMILNEMIHDARVVRLGADHDDPAIRSWLGDSVGWWDGDTLVIETRNFRRETGLLGASENLKVTERLMALDGNQLQYEFTVEDPSIWTAQWSGDYLWPKTDQKIYEYACHEGNYSLGGILRGARLLEQEHSSN